MRNYTIHVGYCGYAEDLDGFADEAAGQVGLARDSSGYDLDSHQRSLTYRFSGSRREAENRARWIAGSLSAAPCVVSLSPELPPWVRAFREWVALAWWVVRYPDDPDQPHNAYLLRCDLRNFRRSLLPFHRCECGKYTRVFWRYRDPHYRDGRWIGPDDCLPF